MLAKSRALDARFGPDESRIVYDYGDGWTIRKLETLSDCLREGRLMRNCLQNAKRCDENAYSLRDADNLPRYSFGVWRVEPGDDLAELEIGSRVAGQLYFHQVGQGLLLVDCAGRPMKPERLEQLLAFLERGDSSEWDRFPTDSGAWVRVIAAGFHFGEFQRAANRVVADYEGSARTSARTPVSLFSVNAIPD